MRRPPDMRRSTGWRASKLALVLGLAAIAAAQGGLVAAAADAPKQGAASAAPAKAEVSKAEAARKQPLQRCDQLADKAQVECLRKARERIEASRRDREGSAKSAGKSAPADAVTATRDAPRQ